MAGSYTPTVAARESEINRESSTETEPCICIQKGIMMNTDNTDLLKKLQTLLSDVGPNGPVWEEELLPDGSVKRKQIPALPRL